jgi:hypothetical protein
LTYFPREQILVHLFDDFIADPARVVRTTLEFLGVDAAFVPDMSQSLGKTGVPRNPLLRAFWHVVGPRRHVVRPFLPKALRDHAFARVTRDLAKPPMRPDTHAELARGFREDTTRLQDLLDRDLSRWLS